jgi:tetratricopeptide (TPR) repeat protein
LPSTLTPPPCMFTVRSRLGYLLMEEEPAEAIELFNEVLEIDPLRLDINALIGETYLHEAEEASEPEKSELLEKAVEAFKAELALSPVTPLSVQLTGDEANNAAVHWALAEAYEELNEPAEAIVELNLYLKATKWHSDTYPWRIAVAQHKIEELSHQ